MQKIFYLIFCLLYSKVVFAASSDYGNCWECSLIEGIYIYTFSFVLRIYNVLRAPISILMLVFFLFWFLWFVWNKLIKNPDKINISDIAKSVFVKLFTVTFVLAMLSLSPIQIFKATVNPIMNFGASFSRWILSYGASESLFKENVKQFDCEKISISSKLKEAYVKHDKSYKSENDLSDDDIDSLKNIVCITGTYSNVYNIGLNIGFNFIHQGFIGYASSKTIKAVLDVVDMAVDFIPEPFTQNIVNIIVKIFKVLAVTETFISLFKIVIGLGIAIAFLYVAFTFMSLIIDVIIKLALVGVMLPIVIGSWAFGGGEDIVKLREKLSGKLFWNVLKVSFRLVFLAIAIVISIMLFSELIRVGDLNTVYSRSGIVGGNLVALTQILFNPVLIMSMIFTTLISWTLLTESVAMADKVSSSLYSGVNDDNILNGLKQLTITSIKFLKGGVQRNISRYKELETTRKNLNNKFNDLVANQSKAKVAGYEQEIFSGDFTNLDKIPAENLIKMYNRMNSDIEKDSINVPSSGGQNTSGSGSKSGNSSIDGDGFDSVAISGVDKGLKAVVSEEQKFLDSKLNAYEEYRNLSQIQKEDLVNIMIDDKGEALLSNTDNDIVKLAEVVARNSKTIMPITSSHSGVKMPISSKPLINKFVKFNDRDSKMVLFSLRQEFINEQILSEVDINKSLLGGKYNKNELKEFIKNPQKLYSSTDNETKNKIKEFEKVFHVCEEQVLARNKITKQQFDEIRLARNTILYQKLKPRLTARSVILAMKKEELNNIRNDIDRFTLLPSISRDIFKNNLDKSEVEIRALDGTMSKADRELYKLDEDIQALEAKSDSDLEDEFEYYVDHYQRHKKRHNRRINPNKKL